MKNLLLSLILGSISFLGTSQSTCDLEVLEFDWVNKKMTLTLNDNYCPPNPGWVPTDDSVYVVQIWFQTEASTCNLSGNNTLFSPNLGLNDTVTYSFEGYNEIPGCFEGSYEQYLTTCEATVVVRGLNNSAWLDSYQENNTIIFSPDIGNCDGSFSNETSNITTINAEILKSEIYTLQGRLVSNKGTLPEGIYVIKYYWSNGALTTRKVYINE